MPVYATISLIMFMSSMGLPLLNGFVGEMPIMMATFMVSKAWAIWAVPGVVLAAAYLLWLYQRVFFGTVTNPKNEKLLDLSPRELATFIPLVALALIIGLYPQPLFKILDQPVNHLAGVIDTHRPGYVAPAVNAEQAVPAKPAVPAPPEVKTPQKPAEKKAVEPAKALTAANLHQSAHKS
jgi:NADH-quinone oxidoreductase subunit M